MKKIKKLCPFFAPSFVIYLSIYENSYEISFSPSVGRGFSVEVDFEQQRKGTAMNGYQIITDFGCNLPEHIAARYQIEIIPTHLPF